MLAQLTFIRLMATKPTADVSGGRGGNLMVEGHQVELADADAYQPKPTLASHGFEAVSFSGSAPGAEIDAAYRQYFAKACAAVVKRETGAAMVTGLPLTVQIRRGDGTAEDSPISVCHTDFTPASAVRKAAEILTGTGHKKMPTRIAAFNAWWLVSGAPQDRPLALCDANSIAPPDLQFGNALARVPDKSVVDYGEIAFQRYNARQRWFWYPQLGPDRLLLFCGFDSLSSRPSMVTHCSFANPECPPNTPPRVSVECRCFAFW